MDNIVIDIQQIEEIPPQGRPLPTLDTMGDILCMEN